MERLPDNGMQSTLSNTMIKRSLTTLAFAAILSLGAMTARADSTTPKSVIHVITVQWKEGTKPEQINAALDGVKTLATEYKGITHVWTHSIKVQGDAANAIVMEFKDAQALKDYTDSPAQKKWYELYTPIRGKSTTFDITND